MTEEMLKRLYDIFEKNFHSEPNYLRSSAMGHGAPYVTRWSFLLDQLGVERVGGFSINSIFLDPSVVFVKNPSIVFIKDPASLSQLCLRVPRDLAEKILVLGCLP